LDKKALFFMGFFPSKVAPDSYNEQKGVFKITHFVHCVLT
jgi:hypothetical protein